MLAHKSLFLLAGVLFACATLQAAPIGSSFSETPRTFEMSVEGGPILTTETTTLNFGDFWGIELTFNEQHDAAGDTLEVEYSIQHLTANHPGVPPVGPVMTGSLEIDASRRFRPQPGTLTVAGREFAFGHGFGRSDYVKIRLLGFSPSRESFDFDSWRLTISGADVPEPSSLLLSLGGGILLYFVRRSKAQSY
jgi:hypothetical protein